MTDQQLQEIKKLNLTPANLEALKYLSQAKEIPASDSLYLLQLMMWGVETQGIAYEASILSVEEVENIVMGVLPKVEPAMLMELIVPETGQMELTKMLVMEKNPKEAAALLLDLLIGNLIEQGMLQ